MLPEKAAELFN